MKIPVVSKLMIGFLFCASIFTFIAVTYDESIVTYLLKQNVYTAYGYIFAFFAFALYVLTLLFTSALTDDVQEQDDNAEEIDYSDVPTTPVRIEPPNSRRRLKESDDQIREFVQIPSGDEDDSDSDNNTDDSSWVPSH